ncbi:unnamed protein product [Durusdinium trenchii]|uniref:Uncharacterized protein n=1 Tax=Durusdinium trenchii TaxID=1381693 RepID=A0ABP0JZ43_9DINO
MESLRYEEHGTCLRGLLAEGILDEEGAEEYLREVHAIDYSDGAFSGEREGFRQNEHKLFVPGELEQLLFVFFLLRPIVARPGQWIIRSLSWVSSRVAPGEFLGAGRNEVQYSTLPGIPRIALMIFKQRTIVSWTE